MVPLIDTHCHLLPGLDDGPGSWEESMAMCRLAWEDGVRGIAATVHQNEHWPNTRAAILAKTSELTQRLKAEEIALVVYPAAEVMLEPDFEQSWSNGRLLTMADRGQYLLIEMPHGAYLEIHELVSQLVMQGVRPVLAHPERCPQLLSSDRAAEDLVYRGCLFQVSASSITDARAEIRRGVRRCARRRMIHLIGSDGHSANKRPPGMARAYEQLCAWEGEAFAEQVCSANGMAILEGLPVTFMRPRPAHAGSRLKRLLLQ